MPGPIEVVPYETPLGAWQLSRAEPVGELREAVIEFREVQGALAPFRETLLPNGAVELVINLGPPHRVRDANGERSWTDAWFSGLHEGSIGIESREGMHRVSARMHPVGAAELLGSLAPACANRIVPLEFLGADAAALSAEIRACATVAERFATLETFLRARFSASKPMIGAIREAATRIDASHGRLRVADLNEAVGVSRKHLAVSFHKHLGIPMKRYAAIRRFLWTLAQLRERDEIEWSALADEAGYSDQSHLARDFRRVGAATPTDYLKRRAPSTDAPLDEVGAATT